jgi:hypothetical protein
VDLPTVTLLLGIVTLLVTGYIAWQQWQINKNKLRLDLFDRRWAVFKAAMRLAETAVHEPTVTTNDLKEFDNAIRGVRFLFDGSLEDYCNKLRKEAVDILFENRKLEHVPVGDERTSIAKTLEGRLFWFSDQIDTGYQSVLLVSCEFADKTKTRRVSFRRVFAIDKITISTIFSRFKLAKTCPTSVEPHNGLGFPGCVS